MAATLKEHSGELAALVAGLEASVVGVRGARHGGGTGVAWNADGVVVTAAHVVAGGGGARVTRPDGTEADATLVGVDPARDLAVLRAPTAGMTPVTTAGLDDARVGHVVLALGRPGRTVRARAGILSALGPEWRTRGGGRVDRYVEPDIARAPGFSGGPLVDAGGRVLGINTSALVRMALVTIPAVTIQRVVDELVAHGRLRRAWLGVATQPVRIPNPPAEIKEHGLGLVITHVEADGPAQRAGIHLGDVLISLGSDGVQTLEELEAQLTGENIGRTLVARILRGGQVLRVDVVLAARPA